MSEEKKPVYCLIEEVIYNDGYFDEPSREIISKSIPLEDARKLISLYQSRVPVIAKGKVLYQLRPAKKKKK